MSYTEINGVSNPLSEILPLGLDRSNQCVCSILPIGNLQIFVIWENV